MSALTLPRKLEIPQAELPMRYGVAYRWGSLHVTESAHDAFGLEPVRTDRVIEGRLPITRGRRRTPNVHIVLVGPDQFDTNKGDTYVGPHLSRRATGLVIGFAETASERAERMHAELNHALDLMDEAPATDDVETDGGQESAGLDPEQLARYGSSVVSHSLAAVVESQLPDALNATFNAEDDRRASNSMAKETAIGLGGAIALMGLSGQPDLVDAGISVGFGGVFVANAKLSVRQYMGGAESRQRAAKFTSAFMAARVADDLHSTFCRSAANTTTVILG